jgi:hypothetical protein
MSARDAIVHDDCADLPIPDGDRLSFLDAHNAYIELGRLVNGKRVARPGEVSVICRDELGWLACVVTHHNFTLDHEFPTLRQAIDFAMEQQGRPR